MNRQVQEPDRNWLSRHFLGLILAGVILLLLGSFIKSYQLIDHEGVRWDRYGKLAQVVTKVLQKKVPPQALLPDHFLHPEQTEQLSLSNGDLRMTLPPKEAPKIVSSLNYQPLVLDGQKQLVLQSLDGLKRAQGAHIQLRFKDMPAREKLKREEKLTYNPVGWHNYLMAYQKKEEQGKAWLMNRGHLVGYQFSGLNDEGRNLVPETRWLNAGDYKAMNAQNQESQLYVEEKLASWLHEHQDAWLDLEVQPLYEGKCLIPEKVQLTFVGLDASGKYLPILIPSKFGVRLTSGAEQITLKNYSPNAIINYATGVAIEK